MQLERLVIQSADRSCEVEFADRLTVVHGLAPGAQERFVLATLDALGGAADGVHVEAVVERRHLAVVRPAGAAHRVLNTRAAVDVTARYRGPNGHIDLLHSMGAEPTLVRSLMAVTPEHLALHSEQEQALARLAAHDQDAVWAAADAVAAQHGRVEALGTPDRPGADDRSRDRSIEHAHRALENTRSRLDGVRLLGLALATCGAMAALAASQLTNRAAGLTFVAAALCGLVAAIVVRANLLHLSRVERQALAEAGADGYDDYCAERLDAALEADAEHRARVLAETDLDAALADWAAVAGTLDWRTALDHASDVRIAATRARSAVEGPDDPRLPSAAAFALALTRRVGCLEAACTSRGLPTMIVYGDLSALTSDERVVLTRLLGGLAGRPQVVFVTSDEQALHTVQGMQTDGCSGVTACQPTMRQMAGDDALRLVQQALAS